MLAKHPLDPKRDKPLSNEELARALRFAIIAELDAINLYTQIAEAVEDEGIRKLFLDVAKEEKTHVGEFMAILKSIDSEQVEELKAGAEEAAELTGRVPPSDPPAEGGDGWGWVVEAFRKALSEAPALVNSLPHTLLGPSATTAPFVVVRAEGGLIKPSATAHPLLKEVSIKFSIDARSVEWAKASGAEPDTSIPARAGAELARLEEELVLQGSKEAGFDGILTSAGVTKIPMSDWGEAGAAVNDVAKAVAKSVEGGGAGPFILALHPALYASLVAVHERTGVTELRRVEALVGKVIPVPTLPEGTAVLVPNRKEVVDVAYAVRGDVEYIGPEDGAHLFRGRSLLALRLKNPAAIVLIKK